MKFERSYCHIIPPVWTVRHPDMAAGWLTEFVRQKGWDVHLLDLNAELYARETRPLVKDCWERLFVAMDPYAFREAVMEQHEQFIRGRIQQVIDAGCRIFGLLLLDGNARMAAQVSKLIRQMAPEAHVVVGGTGATSLYRLRRRYGDSPPMSHPVDNEMDEGHAIDSWVLGEGELTLWELLSRLENGDPLDGVPGLALTADGPYAKFKERALIRDLSSLPHATFEGFDFSLYDFHALPFQLSRGCAFARCSHCGLKGYSRGFRVRQPEHALAELRYHMERHKVRVFHFTDLGVNGDLEKLEGFCDGVIAGKLDIEWQSFVQIRGDMSATLLEKIVRSGCTALNYGFESGSDAVLQKMRKPYSAEEAARVLRMTREAGGKAIINIMVGHPGETEQEFQKTLDFLAENAGNIGMVASVGFTSVHLHSPLVDECEAFDLQLDEDGGWSSADGDIDRGLRNERVHRVTEHLRSHGIPCFEAFWETDRGEQKRELAPELEDQQWLHISSLQVSGPEGDVETPLETDKPVFIRVGYVAGAGVTRAVFDLKITDLWGRTALATPAASETIREVQVSGQGWAQMVLGAHDLPPGTYLVAARVHPLHSERVYDHHILRRPMEVLGTAQPALQVKTPYSWTRHPGPLVTPGESPVLMVRVRDAYGVESQALTVGQPVAVVVGLEQRSPMQGELMFRIFTEDDRCIYESSQLLVELGNPSVQRWNLDALDVAPGIHYLEVTLTAGDQVYTSRHHLRTRDLGISDEHGLAYLAPWERWNVLPEEADLPDDTPQLAVVDLVRQDGVEGPLIPGSPLVVEMVISGLPRGLLGLHCRTWITDEEGLLGVAMATAQVAAPSRVVRLDQHLQLNLLEGKFNLHCALWDLTEDRPRDPVWTFPLVIASAGRHAGGGRVYSQHTLAMDDG